MCRFNWNRLRIYLHMVWANTDEYVGFIIIFFFFIFPFSKFGKVLEQRMTKLVYRQKIRNNEMQSCSSSLKSLFILFFHIEDSIFDQKYM